MERYFSKKRSRSSDPDNDAGTSRSPVRCKQTASNVAASSLPKPSIHKEINLDELPYDPTDRKRISEYTRNPKKQDEIRRRYLTRGPYRPPSTFVYPHRDIGDTQRRFNPDCFKDYGRWLEYSDKVHKAFCLCCYLFRDNNEGQAGSDAFGINGWNSWNKKSRLDTHEGKGNVNSFHNVAVKRCDALMNQVHQGLAFRGHGETEESKNKGNFRELVKTLANQNDDIQKVVLENAPQNCKWVCGDIQKEIANYFAKVTLNSIIEEIGGDVFSLLIDEAADVFDKEQMAVVLRYLKTSAICLHAALQKLFTDLGLSIKQVRGQCYDGASNMRGEFNGLKAKILQENKSAYYVHCFAHQLQLVIVAVAKKHEDISDFFYMISILFNVVGASCKRNDMIREKHREDVIKAIGSGQISTGRGLNQDQTLQRAGDTRWGSHYRTLSSLVKLFPAVMSVLKYVEKEGKNEKKSQAHGLVAYFETFDFVFYLHMMLHILGNANTLSHSLQKKDQDILNAMSCVKSTRNELQELRENGWDSLIQKAYSFCEEHHIEKADMLEQYINRHKPRQKTNKINLQHYRVECLNSVIDWQLQEFGDRFNEVNSALLGHMASFNPNDGFVAFNLDSLVKLAEFYPDDLDSKKWMILVLNCALTLIMCERMKVAIASVERCFSAMNVVKKKLHNKIGDQFMSDCLICYVEKEMFSPISNDDVFDLFKAIKDRKGKL
ncbi:uncharacterized protein [Aegilops tauschii subsp. strangulata]|uniref:uncharacterized protein n=1 Tax=Aegilops tauschii subsp. strangulata TaxID=200361 RepID=UPI003CC853AD